VSAAQHKTNDSAAETVGTARRLATLDPHEATVVVHRRGTMDRRHQGTLEDTEGEAISEVRLRCQATMADATVVHPGLRLEISVAVRRQAIMEDHHQ
jgi:hypothetical protein